MFESILANNFSLIYITFEKYKCILNLCKKNIACSKNIAHCFNYSFLKYTIAINKNFLSFVTYYLLDFPRDCF